MRLPLYQVDAFTDRLFSGNPAAVVPLPEWLSEATMQAIAAENNLAETAFFVREGEEFAIRWFTPAIEATLCGHATLASAYVISRFLDAERRRMAFRTMKAGTLVVERQGDEFAMDFPAWPSTPTEKPAGLAAALGGNPTRCLMGKRDLMAVFGTDAEIADLKPDFAALGRASPAPVIATAPGRDGVDFVSRFSPPCTASTRIPVTGSAHCALIPYWAEQLGKTRLKASQISARGGALTCELRGDRVTMAGGAVLYLEGTITLLTRLPVYQVDAFSDHLFGGNPAAVILLEEWLSEATLQAIAAENNLPATAFVHRAPEGYALRWFTPSLELPLCGHGTLASAHVVLSRLEPGLDRVVFQTQAGPLTVTRQGKELAMELPAKPATACTVPAGLAAALGATPRAVLASTNYLAVFDDGETVIRMTPDFAALQRLDRGVVVTAPGRDGLDCVSRYFAP